MLGWATSFEQMQQYDYESHASRHVVTQTTILDNSGDMFFDLPFEGTRVVTVQMVASTVFPQNLEVNRRNAKYA